MASKCCQTYSALAQSTPPASLRGTTSANASRSGHAWPQQQGMSKGHRNEGRYLEGGVKWAANASIERTTAPLADRGLKGVSEDSFPLYAVSRQYTSRDAQRAERSRAVTSPMTTRPHRALVSATLARRGSDTKGELALVSVITMKSFSRPWKESTVATSTRESADGSSSPASRGAINCPSRTRCASYMATIATSVGSAPPSKRARTASTAAAASSLLRKLWPRGPRSSRAW